MRRGLPLLLLPVALALGAAALPDGPEAKPVQEGWRAVPFGANAGVVQRLFVEMNTIADDGQFRYAWIFETLDTGTSPYRDKKQRIEIDCLRHRYRGIAWLWTDLRGRSLSGDQEELRFNEIQPDSPMEAALTTACAARTTSPPPAPETPPPAAATPAPAAAVDTPVSPPGAR